MSSAICKGLILLRGKRMMNSFCSLNPSPSDKILDHSKLKAFAGNKIKVNQMRNFELGRIENIVGKGENAGH